MSVIETTVPGKLSSNAECLPKCRHGQLPRICIPAAVNPVGQKEKKKKILKGSICESLWKVYTWSAADQLHTGPLEVMFLDSENDPLLAPPL